MEAVRKEWSELKRRALMSPVHLRAVTFSTTQSEAKLPLLSLRWRLYLGVLAIEHFGEEDEECRRAWVVAAEKERSNYEVLRRQFVVNPGALCEEDADWKRMNPLSLDEDSPWFQYHQDQELRTTIMQDVARTFPEEAYFREARVQKLLADILFVYAKLHSSLQYRQGMHELLAPILMAVDRDSVVCDGDAFFVGQILDRRFVEHDAFAMFDKLMRICLPWYQAPSFTSPRLKPVYKPGGNERQAAADMAKLHTPIIVQCHLMMEKLASVEPQLAGHLQSLDIEPQLFGIRWFRLLFSREFSKLSDVFMLWDILLADSGMDNLRLVEWVGIVFLLANRRQLLQGDYADNLSTLLHLPPLPRPTPEALERTPVLRNSPLSPQSGSFPMVSSDISMLTPRIAFTALTAPGTSPIQRLALQAAYLRSRPTFEAAQLVASQYELWEEESWDVIGVADIPLSQLSLEPRREELSNSSEAKSVQSWGAVGSSSPAVAITPAWQGRKTYTSSTLQQRRTTGHGSLGGTSPRSPNTMSPSPFFAAVAASAGHRLGGVGAVADGSDERTSGETVRALGSVTAQVSTMAAQCIDLLLANGSEGDATKHLSTLSAALYTMSRAWQDEVIRSSSPAAASNSDLIRPREMSEADLKTVLRDLDGAYIQLSKLQR
ncbi:hypothetical protein LPJ60_003335 [Coemansia sp. RSA 2675]|nr:hypothetical protein LPJ60_003335 [Coemansia sp. RSA 2675]